MAKTAYIPVNFLVSCGAKLPIVYEDEHLVVFLDGKGKVFIRQKGDVGAQIEVFVDLHALYIIAPKDQISLEQGDSHPFITVRSAGS